mgnify:FL=1
MATNKKTPKRASRFRLRFPFWLDMNKPDEHALAELVETLKTKKLFAKTIRDGIRLVNDLREGRLDVLCELFPWVKEEMGKGRAIQSTDAIEAQLARLEFLMKQGREDFQSAAGPKPLSVPSFSLPRFEDDDADTLIITKNYDASSTTNFVNMMKNLQ